MQPVVTVLMSVFNGEKFLRESIENVLKQTFTNFEFLIINDGCTDRSREIILSFKDERIRLINNENNIGLTKSLNKGIQLARGKFIARMDADDLSEINRFQQQIEYLNVHSETKMVGSSAYVINNDSEVIDKILVKDDNLFERLFFANHFIHTSILAYTDIIKEFYYNEDIRYAQDYYLWSQIARKYKVANITEPLVKYRVHSGGISSSKIDKQEDCVKRTYAFHLSQLGLINCSEKQIELHYLLLRVKINPEILKWNEMIVILKWIRLLRTQNNKLKIYDSTFFLNKLRDYWFIFFQYSYRYGIKASPLIFDDFNHDLSFKAKLLFSLRCIKREIKIILKINLL